MANNHLAQGGKTGSQPLPYDATHQSTGKDRIP